MSEAQQSDDYKRSISEYQLSVRLFGPLQLAPDLNRRTERVIKAHSNDRDHFTEITISENRMQGGIVVDYFVKARSRKSAEQVGHVYLSQLCDLLSSVTESPVQFFVSEEEAREERGRQHRQPLRNMRKLRSEEWSWITGSLVSLRREHPRYLAAASWFRKGLTGNDCLDQFCCFFRVIERIAASYADKRQWGEDEGGVRRSISQLTDDLFGKDAAPALLSDEMLVKESTALRNNISHGNEPITVDMIESASEKLAAIQDAAFCVLDCLRKRNFQCEDSRV